ncbi:hypothetical protein AKJ43_03900 [candidate division MSBL1 archaeon SCGC-AAA261D19]|uniref:HTH arsR-type domain-containing protein n=1 Tax=candidate division MSBL1 archaeon SCGC-AAA261D19 TaxID=1698273 RepID=A0A133V303_9EURY|nr:hypothetical protein AKJ43_03900 [candidate division MSBL1 archaeon SCGC-AAA261D19]
MLAEMCKMLSNPTRLKIIENLREGEKSVGGLVSEIGECQASVSQHLSRLSSMNLVKRRRDGAKAYYRVANTKIFKACDTVREVLIEQFSEIEGLMKKG